jgi:peroxiredoxin
MKTANSSKASSNKEVKVSRGGEKNMSTGPRLERWLTQGCLILMVSSEIVLLTQYWKLRQWVAADSPGCNPLVVQRVANHTMQASDGTNIVLSRSKSSYLVIFLFTPNDCPPCLSELGDLEAVQRARPDVSVFALMSYSDANEAQQARINFGVSFPILIDKDGKTLASLDPPHTPWTIVYDLHNRRIAFEQPQVTSPEERRVLQLRLNKL